MTVKVVANAAQLRDALNSARSGDVIRLEQGTYAKITIDDVNTRNVTIESKDPANPATLSELYIRGSSGLTFRNLEFEVDPKHPVRPFQILNSADIHIDKVSVHGTLNGTPKDDRSALIIRNSENVSVTGSEFQQLQHAIEHLDSRQLSFSGNTFHDIRTDAIRGGGSSDVVITKNMFKDFFPIAGDHGDAVQFWTTHTTASARNIVVSDNIVLRGDGEVVQGIFFRDQVGKLPFENVVIADNLVIGMLYNGISVDGGRNVHISGNTIESFAGIKSRILVKDVDGAQIRGNTAITYIELSSKKVALRDNQTNDFVADGGKATLIEWLAEHGAAPGPSPVPHPQPDTGRPSKLDGNDVMRAADENLAAHLSSGGGEDRLIGSKKNDRLIGGEGDDILKGGAGADQFRFYGDEIEGSSDRDAILDLYFAQGDAMVFGGFDSGTFAKSVGGYAGGSSAIINSYSDLARAAAGSESVTAAREAPGSSNLLVSVTNADGQVQQVLIMNGYAQYLAAGGMDNA